MTAQVDLLEHTFRRLVSAHGATSADYVPAYVDTDSVETLVLDAFSLFVESVRDIPAVEQVRAHRAGAYLHLVTYVSNASSAERRVVYEAESAIHDRFPQLRFEFNLIDRRGHPMVDAPLTGKYVELIRELPDA